MATFSLDINGIDTGVAEGREVWAGELPPSGSYDGILKVLSTDIIGADSQYAGKDKLRVGVELRGTEGGKYDGYLAWGNLNLIEVSLPYINQFLLALTDGSETAFDGIKKAMYGPGPEVDERKKHVLKIGKFNINSPEGELPIKISLSNKPFHNKVTGVTTQQVRIESYLVGGGTTVSAAGPEAAIEDEEVAAVVADDDESLLDA